MPRDSVDTPFAWRGKNTPRGIQRRCLGHRPRRNALDDLAHPALAGFRLLRHLLAIVATTMGARRGNILLGGRGTSAIAEGVRQSRKDQPHDNRQSQIGSHHWISPAGLLLGLAQPMTEGARRKPGFPGPGRNHPIIGNTNINKAYFTCQLSPSALSEARSERPQYPYAEG